MRVGQTNNNPSVQSSETSASHRAEQASKAKGAGRNSKARDAAGVVASASPEISARGKEFARAKAVATSAPDVREEKIAALKKRIADGNYKVDAQAVADRLVEEHLNTAGVADL